MYSASAKIMSYVMTLISYKKFSDCDLQIEGDQSISRKHATLHVAGTEKVGHMTVIFMSTFTCRLDKPITKICRSVEGLKQS